MGAVRLGWQRLFASSEVGGARLDGVYAGLAAGARYELSRASPAGGSFTLLAGMRFFRVLKVSLADHTDGFVTPSSPAMYLAPSLGARYQYRF